MKKIALISGGAGFIGSNMADYLLKKGFKVRVIDNLTTGSLKNIKHNFKNKNYKFKKIDIIKLNRKELFFKNVDYVFHFAGLADLVPSIEDPLKYLNTNFLGTIKMLEAARYWKVKKFVYAASASCYGKTNSMVSETSKINTEHPYAFSKFSGELAVMHWHKVYKLPVNSLRIFNAYGPRSRTSGSYGAVMGVFFKQKLSNKPLTVVGSGKQSRDFIHVSDVNSAFYLAATTKKQGEVYNLGTSQPQTINYLTKLIGGKRIRIPNRPGEAFKSLANINKLRKHLNWKPKTKFKKGISELLKNIQAWNKAPLWDKVKIKRATKVWFKYLS